MNIISFLLTSIALHGNLVCNLQRQENEQTRIFRFDQSNKETKA
uniref:Uncharacterized protein n=1 Tax=Rhizophora mucronata TaxID=61149 RepID=A0A2P2NI17_RHIMU